MLIIRATKGNRNRVDAIFDGEKYLFLNPDMGLIAIVNCNRGHANQDFSYFEVERSEQITKELIEKVVNENEERFHKINEFIYRNEGKEPMHDLNYNLNVEVLFRNNKPMAVKNESKAVDNLYNNLKNLCGKEEIWDALYANLSTDVMCEALNNVAKDFDIDVDSDGNIKLN